MYEPSRLAEANLQDAYACLVPTVRRRLRQAQPTLTSAQRHAERKVQ